MLSATVIICTRNRLTDLIRCLYSLEAQTLSADQLIIVDSSDQYVSSSDQFNHVCDMIRQRGLSVLYLHTQPGLTYQRNQGVAYARGDIIYFFDDDVVLFRDYLATMHATFAQYPDYAGGMGSVQNIGLQPPRWYRVWRKLFLLQLDYASGSFTWSGMPTHAYGTAVFKRVAVLGGCCMAYRKYVFEQEAFDEMLAGYGYMEDCDFSYRVSLKYPLFFSPAARLYHYHSPLHRDAVVTNKAMFIRNYTYLFFKNFYSRNLLCIIGYVWSLIGLFIEAIMYRHWDVARGYIQGLCAPPIKHP